MFLTVYDFSPKISLIGEHRDRHQRIDPIERRLNVLA